MNCMSQMMINTLRPRQNGRHLADDIFKCISVIENIWNSINISLRFARKGRINNISALVKIMAWPRPGDKSLSEPMMVYRRIYASLVLNELRAAKASWRCIKKKFYLQQRVLFEKILIYPVLMYEPIFELNGFTLISAWIRNPTPCTLWSVRWNYCILIVQRQKVKSLIHSQTSPSKFRNVVISCQTVLFM